MEREFLEVGVRKFGETVCSKELPQRFQHVFSEVNNVAANYEKTKQL